MSNGTNYKIGQLDQGFKDVVTRLDRHEKRLINIEKGLDELNIWKWKTIVAISAMSLGGNITFDFIQKLF